MELIVNIDQLTQNIGKMEYYLTEGSDDEKAEAVKLIKRGICFVAYQINNELRFAPSRFLGYVNSKLERPVPNIKHGAKSNNAISRILNSVPKEDRRFEDRYLAYCNNLGIQPNSKGPGGHARKFWVLSNI